MQWIEENLEDNEDPQVFLAEQPNWPFKYSISGVHETDKGIYIEEGTQLAYLDSEVKEAIGW